jgi:hypothetical protein
MRFLNVILGVVGVGALAVASAAGCGGGTGGTGTTGSGTSTCVATLDTCAPPPCCTAVDKNCLGLVDNSKQTKFGLRMSELDVLSPMALTGGLIAMTVGGAVTAADKPCYLKGTATFNWLLQFDTMMGTLKTGGAKPVTDATKGYFFDTDTITQGGKTFMVQPITVKLMPDAMGNFSDMMGQDLIVPIYLDTAGTSVVILPLHQARILMGKLSSNNNCIGTYNATGLQTKNSCQPSAMPPIPQFITTGNQLDGYLTLEEADTVVISLINQTLCVVLSGDSVMYGMPGMGNLTVCKRDAMNNIVYKGGWCSMTNMAATTTCYDAEHLNANFAASSVLINN